MRRKILYAVGFVLAAHNASASNVSAPGGSRLLGDWARANGNVRIVIAPCGTKLCATNTYVRDPRDGQAVGDRLVMTLRPRSASVLRGKAYDVKRNMTYSMTLTIEGNRMRTHGCVLFGMICKTANWTRIP